MSLRVLLTLLALLPLPTAISCGAPSAELLGWTEHYADAFGVDPDLVTAVVWIESRYCPDAVSPKGAIGLGQIMPGTAAGLGIDPTDPASNLWGTSKYLRDKYLEWGDWELALAAYNAGSGAVRKYGGVPPYPETQAYVRNVLYVYDHLRTQRDSTERDQSTDTVAADAN